MRNMEMRREGNKLTIVIPDVSESQGPTSSGKSDMVASSDGAIRVDPDDPQLFITFSLYRKKPK